MCLRALAWSGWLACYPHASTFPNLCASFVQPTSPALFVIFAHHVYFARDSTWTLSSGAADRGPVFQPKFGLSTLAPCTRRAQILRPNSEVYTPVPQAAVRAQVCHP